MPRLVTQSPLDSFCSSDFDINSLIHRLLIIARSTHFVMSSILALSAFHIAYVTGSQEALSLSRYHRNIAAVGLQVAIGSFSKENCDAILAASLVLSWQAADW